MVAGSLIALFDDIATLLDDVASMSKVAAKKTAGVLSDDLAVNAEKVSGVHASRELPVVWAVTKGSLLNKVIIVPLILLLDLFVPWLTTPMLIVGGLYLCYEGAEKLWHSMFTKGGSEDRKESHKLSEALLKDFDADLVELERDRIRGAIRTDFILSLEIVVIALGSVDQAVSFAQKAFTLSIVALGLTLLVYGFVAILVKLDDIGAYLLKETVRLRLLGRGLLWLAPMLMKTLSRVGTAAMFIVGGGILVHGMSQYFGHIVEIEYWFSVPRGFVEVLITTLYSTSVGVVIGLALVGLSGFARRNSREALDMQA